MPKWLAMVMVVVGTGSVLLPGVAAPGEAPQSLVLTQLVVTRTYPPDWIVPGKRVAIGADQETLGPGTRELPLGWSYHWPEDTGPNINDSRATVDLAGVPRRLDAGQRAPIAVAASGSWETSGYGLDRDHTIKLSGDAGTAEWSDVGDCNGKRAGQCTARADVVVPDPLPERLELKVNADLRFGSDHTGSMVVVLVYERRAEAPVPAATGPSAKPQTGFMGAWECPADPVGGTGICTVERIEGVMVLRRPQGDPSVGLQLGPKLVRAQDWGPIKGVLSEDEQRIVWTSGVVWQRPAPPAGETAASPEAGLGEVTVVDPGAPELAVPGLPPVPSAEGGGVAVVGPADLEPPLPDHPLLVPAGEDTQVGVVDIAVVPAWGMMVASDPKGLLVLSVAPESMGEMAGLTAGCIITTINGKPARDMKLPDAVTALCHEPLPGISYREAQ
jgi:hypothetical protein